MEYIDYLKVGFIQTVVEGISAWGSKSPYNKNMSALSEEKVWYEIKKGFIDLSNGYEKPNIILIPELSIPTGYEHELIKLSAASGAVVIGGLDFVWNGKKVTNKAIVSIPKNWPKMNSSKSCSFFYFGKTFYSRYEEHMFDKANLVSQPEIFILDAGEYGKIGIAICSDFFDIERFVVYKGRIHHLIIIAHNPDTESYYFLAEAISRLVYCNVAICNTGEYGDSIAFTPYEKNYERIVYRHKGSKLFSTQVISFPVQSLDNEQDDNTINKKFKARPPGYKKNDFGFKPDSRKIKKIELGKGGE